MCYGLVIVFTLYVRVCVLSGIMVIVAELEQAIVGLTGKRKPARTSMGGVSKSTKRHKPLLTTQPPSPSLLLSCATQATQATSDVSLPSVDEFLAFIKAEGDRLTEALMWTGEPEHVVDAILMPNETPLPFTGCNFMPETLVQFMDNNGTIVWSRDKEFAARAIKTALFMFSERELWNAAIPDYFQTVQLADKVAAAYPQDMEMFMRFAESEEACVHRFASLYPPLRMPTPGPGNPPDPTDVLFPPTRGIRLADVVTFCQHATLIVVSGLREGLFIFAPVVCMMPSNARGSKPAAPTRPNSTRFIIPFVAYYDHPRAETAIAGLVHSIATKYSRSMSSLTVNTVNSPHTEQACQRLGMRPILDLYATIDRSAPALAKEMQEFVPPRSMFTLDDLPHVYIHCPLL